MCFSPLFYGSLSFTQFIFVYASIFRLWIKLGLSFATAIEKMQHVLLQVL